jgi:plastocyanin
MTFFKKIFQNWHRKRDSGIFYTHFHETSENATYKDKAGAINSINLITWNRNLFFMKKLLGLCILVILFFVMTGCTQPAPSTPATTVPTTEPVPMATTQMATPMATVEENTTVTVATVTAPATSVVTTVPPTPSPAQTPVVTARVIHMRNNTFVPPVTTVLPGTGITWVNDDTISHAVKATGLHEGMFNSGDIVFGTSWSNAFGGNEAIITYSDPKFPGMNGTLIIKNGITLADVNPVAVVTQP